MDTTALIGDILGDKVPDDEETAIDLAVLHITAGKPFPTTPKKSRVDSLRIPAIVQEPANIDKLSESLKILLTANGTTLLDIHSAAKLLGKVITTEELQKREVSTLHISDKDVVFDSDRMKRAIDRAGAYDMTTAEIRTFNWNKDLDTLPTPRSIDSSAVTTALMRSDSLFKFRVVDNGTTTYVHRADIESMSVRTDVTTTIIDIVSNRIQDAAAPNTGRAIMVPMDLSQLIMACTPEDSETLWTGMTANPMIARPDTPLELIVHENGHYVHIVTDPEEGTITIRDSIGNKDRANKVATQLRLVLKGREVAAGFPDHVKWRTVIPAWPAQSGPDCAIYALAARAEHQLGKANASLAKASPTKIRQELPQVVMGDGSVRSWDIPPRAPPPAPRTTSTATGTAGTGTGTTSSVTGTASKKVVHPAL